VLNVVTADRVVAQISTTHTPGQPTPAVTFLGTHFENLRIARHRAEPYMKLDMCQKPGDPKAMHVDSGSGFLQAVEKQYNRLKKGLQGLDPEKRRKTRLEEPDARIAKKYHGLGLNAAEIQAQGRDAYKNEKTWDGVTCSLVENVEIKDISVKNGEGEMIHVPPPGPSFGHVIHVPDFGNIFLAELTVNHNSYHLTMIRLELGCLAEGTVGLVSCNVNGKGHP
jgi:hypothetical protein